ncbi:MAG: tetratricopeptide repeat protein [Anaerolineae bacterium]|nr:tetratricopeptide repeat protein [Anaerolineae bacterium]
MLIQSQNRLYANRYLLHSVMGEGGMGSVYRAEDRLTGRQVALKRVLTFNDDESLTETDETEFRLALAQEFKILASLRHPNIINVLDYGFDDKRQPFFTMDLLINPQTILRAAKDQPLQTKIDYLIQLLYALAYLHRRDMVHRDLKPENVLVQDGQVKVLDFGLSAAAGQLGVTSGTLPYMSPEVLRGEEVSPASDLYAVGVIAYEMFAGRLPFEDQWIDRMLENILDSTPNLDNLGTNHYLNEVIGKLLSKAPEDRYPDAVSTIHAFSDVIGQPVPPENRAIRESFLQAAHFVGREVEMNLLTSALNEALQGSGGAWLIGGESGVGKSRLLNEIATLALIQGALVLRGQGVQEGARPYEIWLDSLRHLAVSTTLGDDEAGILKNVVPEIDALLDRSVPETPFAEPGEQAGKLFLTLMHMLRRQSQPIVIIFEDMQWIGAESLTLLREIVSLTPDLPMMIIGSYRADESPQLRDALPDMRFLLLSRLSDVEIRQMSEAMLGEVGRQPEVIDLLERETEGNAFFLVEVTRALAEEAGQLSKIGKSTLPAHVFAGGMQRIIKRRLAQVPAEAWPLLRQSAVIGRAIDLDLLAQLEQPYNLQQWVTECANAAVLEVQNGQWRFAHDKLREGVLDVLHDTLRRELHRNAAQALERLHPDSLQQAASLAYHWGMAGNLAKEYRFARAAGLQSRLVSNFAEALAHFQRALDLCETVQQPEQAQLERAQIVESLGSVYFWMGEFKQARGHFELSLTLAQEKDDKPLVGRSLFGIGDALLQQGYFIDARRYYQRSLLVAQNIRDEVVISHALAGLGDVAWRVQDFALAERYLRANLTLARKTGHLIQICNGLNLLGIINSLNGRHPEAVAYFSECITAAREIGDRSRIAQALSNLGELERMQGRMELAKPHLEEALTISRQIGNRYSESNVLLNLGQLSFAVGDYNATLNYLHDALQMSYQIGSTPLVLGSLGSWAHVLFQAGVLDRAVSLASFALHHPGSSPDMRELVIGSLLTDLQQVLSPEVYEMAYERGMALDLNATVQEVLADMEAVAAP